MPTKEPIGRRSDIFLLHDFLTAQECREWIARSESTGYEEAAINTAGGQRIVKQVRNNDRLIWDDVALGEAWWARAREFLPPNFGLWKAIGFNERFRFYRYGPGQRFAPHRDGSFERQSDEMSWMTFMVYLNDDFVGGQTRFDLMGEPEPVVVQPRPGMALVFMHDRLHAGDEVTRGHKYVLRTDVMYRREPRGES